MLESTPSNRQPQSAPFNSAIAAAVILLGVALALVLGPWQFTSPVPPAVVVAPRMIDPTPVRQPSYKPLTVVAGKTYRCSDCHKNFGSPAVSTLTLTQHMNIVLRHGSTTVVSTATTPQTGMPTWGIGARRFPGINRNDSAASAMGRSTATGCMAPMAAPMVTGTSPEGTQTRLQVHRMPRSSRTLLLPPLHPCPAPNTLRMGDQHFEPEAERVANPLQVYRQAQLKLAGKSRDDNRTH